MKWVKSFKKYKESLEIDLALYNVDLKESLNLWHDVILGSIGAKEEDIYDIIKLPKEQYQNKMNIDFLSNDVEFINSLASIGLKKSPVQSTDDFECFINKPCKFMFIYGVESNELENPIYILFESWNETLKKWDDAKLYKVNDDVKRFYDKLSSKTIEVTDGEENYIYSTSNGNEWELQNNKESDVYQKVLRNDDFEKLVNDRKAKLKII
jgi:hypothetical protein